MSNSEIYLVRHGEAMHLELTELGRIQAAEAAVTLRRLITDTPNITLLSSDRLRTTQTADIIASSLNLNVAISESVGDVGNSPYRLQGELKPFLLHCLQQAGVNHHESSPLVVVTHAPMLAAAKGSSPLAISNGQVERYDGHTWNIREH